MTSHLTLSERRIIAGMLQRKISVAQIAVQLGRHRSTIHREIKRNFWNDAEVPMATGYWHMDAQHLALNVATVVERISRYTVIFRNNDRRSKPLMDNLIYLLSPLPWHARQSLTFDRGLEFVSWRELEKGLGAQAWLSNRIASVKPFCKSNTDRAPQARQDISAVEPAKPSFVSIQECARLSEAWLSPQSARGCRISVSAGKAFLCFARSPLWLQPGPSEWLDLRSSRDASSHQGSDALSSIAGSLMPGFQPMG